MKPLCVLLLVLAAAGLTGCSGGSAQPGPSPTGDTAASWIFTKQALDAVTANPQARARLSDARIFEILTQNEQPSMSVAVVPTVSFKSFATLRDTINSGRLRPGIRAVIYDSEHWAQTPSIEQLDPAGYYLQAATVVHAHGLIFIATPAMDLVNAAGGKAADPAQDFLARGIDGSVATYADVVDVQSQSLEEDTAAYRDFVLRAAAQIKSANPAVTVIAGLSTNPRDSAITSGMLVSDMTSVAGTASGFWLNIPDEGPGCGNCAAPRPDVAVGALTDSRLATLNNLFRN